MKRIVIVPIVLLFGCSGLFFPSGYGSSNECVDDNDCKKNESCYGPTSSNCGIQQTGECTTSDDSSCPRDQVCKPASGGCTAPNSGFCVPDCRAEGCSMGECDESTGMCMPPRCTDDGAPACPSLFTCTDGQGDGPNGCERLSCDGDGDCPAENTCWDSQCYENAARCSLPAP